MIRDIIEADPVATLAIASFLAGVLLTAGVAWVILLIKHKR
jgi:hypothetical protein